MFGLVVGIVVCVPVYSIIVRTPAFDPKTQQASKPRAIEEAEEEDTDVSGILGGDIESEEET